MILSPLNSEDILLTARISQLLNQTHHIAFALLDADLHVKRASDNLRSLTVRPDLAPEGQVLPDLFPEFVGTSNSLAAIVRGEAPPYVLRRVNRTLPDGSTAFLTFRVTAFDESQLARGLLLMVEDTTPNSQLEQRLLQDRNELKLLQERFANLNDELQRLNRFKTAVLSIVAQDLQTPLAVVQVYANLLLERPANLTDEQSKHISIIRAQIDKVNNLLAGVFDFDRIEEGQLHLNRADCDFSELVRTSISMLSALLDLHRIGIDYSLHDSPLEINADASRLQRVIYDVLSYAMRQAVPSSCLDVQLRSERRMAVLHVNYSGRAPSPTEMAALFRTSDRTETAQRVGYGASGLGLLIAKTIVEAHGGRFEISHYPDKHTQLSLRLPFA